MLSAHLLAGVGQASEQKCSQCPLLPQPQQASFSILAVFSLEPPPLLLCHFTATLRFARLEQARRMMEKSACTVSASKTSYIV